MFFFRLCGGEGESPVVSTLFLGLPRPRLGEADEVPARMSGDGSPCALRPRLAGFLEVERRFPELLRALVGVPLGFLRTSDDMSSALRGTVVVNVLSAKCLAGEDWGLLDRSE